MLFYECYVFQCTVLQKFKEAIFDEDETPLALKPVLLKLCSLYGLSSLETHLTTLYQGNATTGKECCPFVSSALPQVIGLPLTSDWSENLEQFERNKSQQ